MFLIGLTGGIAAGKSTVAAHWVSLGAIEIDADQIAREVVAPGTPGLAAIEAEFGSTVITETGSLDRAALGEIVFNNPQKRLTLEKIAHPLVQAESRRQISAQRPDAIVVYNAALLVEAGVKHDFDRVVTVEAPFETQIQRLISNRGMTEAQARARIGSQTNPAARANIADFIINSNQDLHLMLKDAGKLWLQFEREADAKNRLAADQANSADSASDDITARHPEFEGGS